MALKFEVIRGRKEAEHGAGVSAADAGDLAHQSFPAAVSRSIASERWAACLQESKRVFKELAEQGIMQGPVLQRALVTLDHGLRFVQSGNTVGVKTALSLGLNDLIWARGLQTAQPQQLLDQVLMRLEASWEHLVRYLNNGRPKHLEEAWAGIDGALQLLAPQASPSRV